MDDRLLTPAEVAERLRVSVKTVQDWCRRGRLPVVQIAGPRGLQRIPESALQPAVTLGVTAAVVDVRPLTERRKRELDAVIDGPRRRRRKAVAS